MATRILLGLDLLIWHGERVGLIGPNGAGKSVLLRCILGRNPQRSGDIKIGPSVHVGLLCPGTRDARPGPHADRGDLGGAVHVRARGAVNFLRQFLFPYRRTRDKSVRFQAVSAAAFSWPS